MSEQVEVTYKTCLITVVEPGMPDKVIKVHPALHDTEKIWLDHRPGIERWASVQQLFKRFCPRGKYVPEAAYWHQPGAKPEEVNTLILRPEDIPLVNLDGAVFEPLPKQERPKHPKQEVSLAKDSLEKVAKLEQRVEKLTDLLTAIVANQQAVRVEAPAPETKRGPGRPKKGE